MVAYTFRYATEDWEFEQIHRLNYRAFVEEIPQHAPNPERRLVDQFHHENTYAIGLVDDTVVAMLALRSQRPFSLDKKLPNLDQYLPPNQSMCEIRLLYVVPEHRNGKVLRGLMELVAEYGIRRGHTLALISGTTRQQRLYRHLGFVPFGPQVGTAEALFQPMYLTLEAAQRQTPWVRARRALQEGKDNGQGARRTASATSAGPVNFLPGPVNIPAPVQEAFSRAPVSHRGDRFMAYVQEVKERLCALVNARAVELLFGSGTLANEAVAAQIAQLPGPGLVLSNGEFGRRLVDHARRWRLRHALIEAPWGEPLDYAAVEHHLTTHPALEWLWCVHSETSTGILNDLPRLTELCRRHDVKLCVDCISSIGAVPLDLGQVYLATGASGKALASYAGVAMVFYNHPIPPAPTAIPRYLDLGIYAASDGVPFTISSNLVYALGAALEHRARYGGVDALGKEISAMAEALRAGLRDLGLTIVAPDAHASPAVTTIALPPGIHSVALGDCLEERGYLLSYKSSYLVERNWIQVCLMGEVEPASIERFLAVLGELVGEKQRQGRPSP
ncbi:hypothetical protein RY27_17610 [Litorilinea aerophila]|nr:hypothetical protein RY27_17610 [Litorilinea aerophila]